MTEHPQTEVLVATRESLHRVAEHVLAAALKRATGQITPARPPGRLRNARAARRLGARGATGPGWW